MLLNRYYGVKGNTTATLERYSLENEFLTAFSFAANKKNVLLPIYKIVGVLQVVVYLRILRRKFNIAQPRSLQNLENAHSTLLGTFGNDEHENNPNLHI